MAGTCECNPVSPIELQSTALSWTFPVSFRGWVIFLAALIVCVATCSGQEFDPRCSSRSGSGRFNCTLKQPVVTRADWTYQVVQFAPGDKVYVNADGCVQTGGSGPTWKRYVNPTGGDSDRLYHGLVRIPSGRLAGTDVGNTMTRIKDVVGRLITVTGQGVATSALVLHLGYEDDNLSDNGYYRHDDGTDDQCKQGPPQNGPAEVTITICRGEPFCDYVDSRFDFDVLSNQVDPNGFLYNPHWSWQDKPGNHGQIPQTSLCHEFSKRDFARFFWRTPNFPDCTDQAGLDDVNSPDTASVNNLICTPYADSGSSFAGHVNWFPVTVEGSAGPVTHEWKDDDYDFSLATDHDSDGSLYSNDYPDAHRKYLHVEFDSDETVDHFKSSEWAAFHQAVDDGNADDMFKGHIIATGLFGLDGEHNLKSELHPLYAMAAKRDNFENSQSDEVWLMFVRNRGDEGYCSSQLWSAGFEDYTFRLPWREGMTSVDVNWDKTEFEGSDGTSTKPDVRVVAPNKLSTEVLDTSARIRPTLGDPIGVYVTFHLGLPATIPVVDSTASIPYIDGALHLIWTGVPANPILIREGGVARSDLQRARTTLPAAKEHEDDAEQKLGEAVNRLPEQQRVRVQGSRAIPSKPVPVHKMTHGSVQIVNAPAVSATWTGRRPPIAGPAGRATRKLARDAAQMNALCAASGDRPYGLPAEVCKSNVRDHRTTRARDHR